jgi:hypothetical protein
VVRLPVSVFAPSACHPPGQALLELAAFPRTWLVKMYTSHGNVVKSVSFQNEP